MASKSLNSLSGTNIPQFGESITGARDKRVVVSWVDADAHNISQMIRKFGYLGTRLNIPFHAGHVSRRGQDGPIVEESTAG